MHSQASLPASPSDAAGRCHNRISASSPSVLQKCIQQLKNVGQSFKRAIIKSDPLNTTYDVPEVILISGLPAGVDNRKGSMSESNYDGKCINIALLHHIKNKKKYDTAINAVKRSLLTKNEAPLYIVTSRQVLSRNPVKKGYVVIRENSGSEIDGAFTRVNEPKIQKLRKTTFL